MNIIHEVYLFNTCARPEGSGEAWTPQWPFVQQAARHCYEELREMESALADLQRLSSTRRTLEGREAWAEAIDGALDLAYVAVNILWSLGVPPEVALDAFKRIQTSNMRKIPDCPTCFGVGYTPEEGEYGKCTLCDGTGLGIPTCTEGLKIVKPEGWTAPDILSLVPPAGVGA